MSFAKRKRMEFEDVSDEEDVKPAKKGMKVEEGASVLSLGRNPVGPGSVKSEDEVKLDVKPSNPIAPLRFEVFVNGDSKITKTNSKDRFNLRQDDFEKLHFDVWQLRTRPYVAHLYDIIDVWTRAVQLRRIPWDSPRPQIGPHWETLTMAQALPCLPGCKTMSDCFEPWIWRAIARYYERTVDVHAFGRGAMNTVIEYQLTIGVQQELNKLYRQWSRNTAPLRPSQPVSKLQSVLTMAPLTGVWTKDYKRQVNGAVDEIIKDLGQKYEMAARWLVYEKLAVCNGGLHWNSRLGRWTDSALEALEGALKV